AWSLSFKLFSTLVNHPCTYCQGSLDGTGTGLDRINNQYGYSQKNVIPCCGTCNRMRSDKFTVNEMRRIGKLLQQIYKKRG
ncbi:MAG: hypothetical protein V3U54_08980, partial [Thermodesulfobacteriota bacterium]